MCKASHSISLTMVGFLGTKHNSYHLTCGISGGNVFCLDCASDSLTSGTLTELRQLGIFRQLNSALENDSKIRSLPGFYNAVLPSIFSGLDASDPELSEAALDCLSMVKSNIQPHLKSAMVSVIQKLLTVGLPNASNHLCAFGVLLEVSLNLDVKEYILHVAASFADSLVAYAARNSCTTHILSTIVFVCFELVGKITDAFNATESHSDFSYTDSSDNDPFVKLLLQLPRLIRAHKGESILLNAAHYFAAASRYCLIHASVPGWCISSICPISKKKPEFSFQNDFSPTDILPHLLVLLFNDESLMMSQTLKTMLLCGNAAVSDAASKFITYLCGSCPSLSGYMLKAGLGDFLIEVLRDSISGKSPQFSFFALEALYLLAVTDPLTYFSELSFLPRIMYPFLLNLFKAAPHDFAANLRENAPSARDLVMRFFLHALRSSPPPQNSDILSILLHCCISDGNCNATASETSLSATASVLKAILMGPALLPKNISVFWQVLGSLLTYIEEVFLLFLNPAKGYLSNAGYSRTRAETPNKLLKNILSTLSSIIGLLKLSVENNDGCFDQTIKFRCAGRSDQSQEDIAKKYFFCVVRALEIFNKDVITKQKMFVDADCCSESSVCMIYTSCITAALALGRQASVSRPYIDGSLAASVKSCSSKVMENIKIYESFIWLLKLWNDARETNNDTSKSTFSASKAIENALLTILFECAAEHGLICAAYDGTRECVIDENDDEIREGISLALNISLKKWTGTAVRISFERHVFGLMQNDGDIDIRAPATLALLLLCSSSEWHSGSQTSICASDTNAVMNCIHNAKVALFSLEVLKPSACDDAQTNKAALDMLNRFPVSNLVCDTCFTVGAAAQVLLLESKMQFDSSSHDIFLGWLRFAPLERVTDICAELISMGAITSVPLTSAVLKILDESAAILTSSQDSRNVQIERMSSILLLDPCFFFSNADRHFSHASQFSKRFAMCLKSFAVASGRDVLEGKNVEAILRLSCACIAIRSDLLAFAQYDAEFSGICEATVCVLNRACQFLPGAGSKLGACILVALNLLNLLSISLFSTKIGDFSVSKKVFLNCSIFKYLSKAWEFTTKWWASCCKLNEEISIGSHFFPTLKFSSIFSALYLYIALRSVMLKAQSNITFNNDIIVPLYRLSASLTESHGHSLSSVEYIRGSHAVYCVAALAKNCCIPTDRIAGVYLDLLAYTIAGLSDDQTAISGFIALYSLWKMCEKESHTLLVTEQPWNVFLLEALTVYYGPGKRDFPHIAIRFLTLILPGILKLHAHCNVSTIENLVNDIGSMLLTCAPSNSLTFGYCACFLAAVFQAKVVMNLSIWAPVSLHVANFPIPSQFKCSSLQLGDTTCVGRIAGVCTLSGNSWLKILEYDGNFALPDDVLSILISAGNHCTNIRDQSCDITVSL